MQQGGHRPDLASASVGPDTDGAKEQSLSTEKKAVAAALTLFSDGSMSQRTCGLCRGLMCLQLQHAAGSCLNQEVEPRQYFSSSCIVGRRLGTGKHVSIRRT
ncbi:unnamed protein product [Symbiodinium natans]|uniref:Uncharacterized protein n=1 Tax=Symbiodinium natans TaxID=878477 RepID=A0A812I7I8_9DINO|nr:unnamed protein product [Symbiodinium natans]